MTLISLMAMSFVSCTKESLEGCEVPDQGRTIKVSYLFQNKNNTLGIDPADVKNVTLFIFDKNNKFVTEYTDTPVGFSSDYFTNVDLEPGVYTFVSWFNLGEGFSVQPNHINRTETALEESLLVLDRPIDDTIRTIIPPLMHAIYTTAEVKNRGDHHFELPMVQNSKRLNITVKGLQPDDDTYSFSVTDNNGKFDFTNQPLVDNDFHILSTGTFGADNNIFSSLTTLSLSPERRTILRITNNRTGKQIFVGDIIVIIKAALNSGMPSIDWVNTNVFDIIIKFNADMSTEFTINGWNFVHEDLEIGGN